MGNSMLDTQSWDRFVHSLPGRRFQERYRRKSASDRGRLARFAVILGGIGLALVGIFFLAVPGPGIPILAIGLALIAQESAGTARLLDRAEVRLRRWWKRLRR
jgi:Putative transmembrane protein (PGPGW)